MKANFHFQSMLIGGVFTAVMLAMILPTFGQGRDRNGGWNEFDPSRHGQAQGHVQEAREPVTVVVESGRYQVVASDRVAYLIDTQTGEVWKDRDMSDQPMSSRGFYDIKLNHRH